MATRGPLRVGASREAREAVPEACRFKSIKWLIHLNLTNLPTANDTYAEQNNDLDSPLKTFAASISVLRNMQVCEAIPFLGHAQVGISGLAKVQVWVESQATPHSGTDLNFITAPWGDAELLPATTNWSDLPDGKIPSGTHGVEVSGKPKNWPIHQTNAHWAAVLPGLPTGEYTCAAARSTSRAMPSCGPVRPVIGPRRDRSPGHSSR